MPSRQGWRGITDAKFNPDDTTYDTEKLVELSRDREALLICATDKIPCEVIERLPEGLKAIANVLGGIRAHRCPGRERPKHHRHEYARSPERGDRRSHDDDHARRCPTRVGGRGDDPRRTLGGLEPYRHAGNRHIGKPLGIYGMGGIGRAVAARAKGFDMEVHYHNRNRLPPELENGAEFHETPESFASGEPRTLAPCSSHARDTALPDEGTDRAAPGPGDRGQHRTGRLGGRRGPHRRPEGRASWPPPGWMSIRVNRTSIRNTAASGTPSCYPIWERRRWKPATPWDSARSTTWTPSSPEGPPPNSLT